MAGFVARLPACNGRVAVAGFCWGGGQSFRFATNRPDLRGAFVFYGPAPKTEDLGRIRCPVYGFYAGNDARITSTVPATSAAMKAAGKTFEPATYDGAGHGFMRAGESDTASPANRQAMNEGWKRWLELLAEVNQG